MESSLAEVYLICFGAGAVIHGAQAILAARLLRHSAGTQRLDAVRDGVMLGLTTFFWQFGNFLVVFVSSLGFESTSPLFRTSNFVRDGALTSFPLLFSYLSVHLPPGGNSRSSGSAIGRFGKRLRYVLWPWTVSSLAIVAAATAGLNVPRVWPNVVMFVTLHLMLLYFVLFTVVTAQHRTRVQQTKIASLIRAQKAGFIAGLLAIALFVLMLGGYWNSRIPFLRYIELAAMMTSVPFVIAVAYRQYQFPFMDAFVREVISGVILVAVFVAALSISNWILWVTACAAILVYLKAPLTRWVERVFCGYREPVEEQERRIGTAIRALTQFDAVGARVAEILASELEAEWVEIDSSARADAAHRFEIPGSGLWLSVGLRAGGRQYMSRQLRIASTAALQLAAHHHQLRQHELREATARAQMQALQAQINPHFLFNTLNVLANLIHTDPAKAERVTEELADIFRYALESTRRESVNLSDELQFLESYLEIEKTRFQERLSYSFDVDPALRALKIPPMILQPLVENAIKHGIGPKVQGGEIKVHAAVTANLVVIVVEDNGAGPQSGSRHRGAGVGLANVRERLQHVYGDAGTLQLEPLNTGGMRAVLTFPETIGVHS
jgi:two-component sensor histidine kinase